MNSDSKNPSSPQSDVSPTSRLFDDWIDPIESGVRARVRDWIEALVHSELDTALQRPRYGRSADGETKPAVAPVRGYRNGSRTRTLTGDPVAGDELGEQCLVETARRLHVDVLDDGRLAQAGELQPADEPLVLALDRLAVDHEREPLLEAKRGKVGLLALLLQRFGHAGEPRVPDLGGEIPGCGPGDAIAREALTLAGLPFVVQVVRGPHP